MIDSQAPTLSELPLDGELWRFAIGVYTRPGVSAACLSLQEGLGLDVNLLLFAVWMGAERGIVLTPEDFEAADEAIGAWHREVVRPLRAVRQRMKDADYSAWAPSVDALRNRIKGLELEAERLELARLQLVGDRIGGEARARGTAAAAANLATLLSRAEGEGDWADARETILREAEAVAAAS